MAGTGKPKTGGRAPGTPNKVNRGVEEKLAAIGCDPILGLAQIAMDPENDVKWRLSAYAELAPYVAPKRKPVDGEGNDQDAALVVQIVRLGADDKAA